VRDWESSHHKAEHLRWIRMAQERHRYAALEEKRKEEILGIFRSLVKLASKQRLGSGFVAAAF
jgi:DnaJ-domain-containing protein 1